MSVQFEVYEDWRKQYLKLSAWRKLRVLQCLFSVLFSFQKEKSYLPKGFLVPLRMVHGKRVFSCLLSSSSRKGRLNYHSLKRLSLISFCRWWDSVVQGVAGQGTEQGPILCFTRWLSEKTADDGALLNTRTGYNIQILSWVGWWEKCLAR